MPEVITNESEGIEGAEPELRKQIREEEEQDTASYLQSLAATMPIRVTLRRTTPRLWKGTNISGTIETYEEPITEEMVKEAHGGGKYQLVIKTPDSKGRFVYRANRTIEIAGDPRIDGLIISSNDDKSSPAPSGPDPAVLHALNMSSRMVDAAERRASERGTDPALAMAMDEMRALRAEMKTKDDRMMEVLTAKKDSAAEMLLGKAIDGESARIQSMQARMESELRQKNDTHRAEIDRLHQRYEDIARRQEDSHKREIDMITRSLDSQMATLKLSYEGQIEGFKREITHLAAQLNKSETELAALRVKKDKSPTDTISEIVAMKTALESLTGSGEKEEGSAFERIVGNVMDSPLISGIATRVAGGPEAAAAATNTAQPQGDIDIPFNQPVQLPDGRIIMRKTSGAIVEIKRKVPAPSPTGGPVEVSDTDIKVAIQFMETALAGDADPDEFARTARNLAPSLASGPMRDFLKTQGVDALLERVAKLSPGSPLLSQHGKNWTRKVAKALLS
jgi:hypothetical protein